MYFYGEPGQSRATMSKTVEKGKVAGSMMVVEQHVNLARCKKWLKEASNNAAGVEWSFCHSHTHICIHTETTH